MYGDFEFDELYGANRIYTPLLVFSYIIITMFMLINLFLAIVSDSYSEVPIELWPI